MGEVKVWSHNVSLTFYRLTSLSFHVNQPSHSWDTIFSKFDLKNPRLRSWKRWTLKVTSWVQHSFDSHPFHSMSIGHPIPEIQHFQILVKVMGEGNVESHKVGVTSYWLTSLSFHVNRPSHSWDTAFSKFDLENPRSRSWVRWTMKATTWVQHSIDSHPFNSMSIGHPIPEIQLFQNLTLKIQGQGHVWGECWKSQSGCNILSTHIPFVPCQSALPFLRYSIFKIWPWKSKVKVKWSWCCTTTDLDYSIEPQLA